MEKTSTTLKSLNHPDPFAWLVDELKTTDVEVLRRYALLGKKIETILKNEPIALISTVGIGPTRYKRVKIPLGIWNTYAAQLSSDHSTPLDALNAK